MGALRAWMAVHDSHGVGMRIGLPDRGLQARSPAPGRDLAVEPYAAKPAPLRDTRNGATASAGVLDARRDAVDRRHQRLQQRSSSRPPARQRAQQVDLQQADRIDVGIAQADRLAQARVVGQQFVAALDREDRVARALELGGDAGMEARVQRRPAQRASSARRCPGRTWPAPSRRRRPACRRTASRAPSPPAPRGRALRAPRCSARADAVPARSGRQRFCAQANTHGIARSVSMPARSPAAGALARARADAQALDHVDRRGGAEVGREIRRRRAPARGSARAHRWPARAAIARQRASRGSGGARPQASRAAPRRWSAPGCAAPARGCRTCGGSPRPARSGAGSRRPSRAARRSPRARSCRRRG